MGCNYTKHWSYLYVTNIFNLVSDTKGTIMRPSDAASATCAK